MLFSTASLKIALAEAETRRAIRVRSLRLSTKRWRRATAWAIARLKQSCIGAPGQSAQTLPRRIRACGVAFLTAIAVVKTARHAQLRTARSIAIALAQSLFIAQPAEAFARYLGSGFLWLFVDFRNARILLRRRRWLAGY